MISYFSKKKYKEIAKLCGYHLVPFFFVYYYLHKVLEYILSQIIIRLFPINDRVIIFMSTPDYSDNARALAEYMVDNGYTDYYRIFFAVKEPNNFKNCCNSIRFFSCFSNLEQKKFRYLKLLNTSGYLLTTHKVLLHKKHARKGQRIINLWHGCGFKDRSIQDGKGPVFFDVALVPGPLFVRPKAYFWNTNTKNILPIGYPRYDWLKQEDPAAKTLIDSFKIQHDTKVIIWMPTFRIDKRGKCIESNSITQFPLIHDDLEWKELDILCKKLNIVIIIKLHPFQSEYVIPFDKFSNIKRVSNHFFEEKDMPMYKFIALTDALISDYSSIAIDYLIVNRPIAFCLDDYEKYRKTRGFVFEDPRLFMPGHHLYSINDMKVFLSDVSKGKDPFVNKRKEISSKAICHSDNYCKSILKRFGIE